MIKNDKVTYLNNKSKIKPTINYTILNKSDESLNVKSFHIIFRITESCDLACEYCEWHFGKHYKIDDILSSVDKIFEFLVKIHVEFVNFYFHGGEATRHPDIVKILKYIKNKGESYNIVTSNEMQTNLTVNLNDLKNILEYTDLLDITFHYNELKKKHKLNSFIDNYNYIISQGHQINNLDIMLEYISFDMITEFRDLTINFLSNKNITNSEMIYYFGFDYKFNKETKELHYEFFKEYNTTSQTYNIDGKIYDTNELFNRGLDCSGCKCDAGKNFLYINGDGNIFQCAMAATNTLKKFKNEVFSNLLTDNLVLTKLSILSKVGTLCRWDYCGGDFYIPRTIQ